MEQSRGNRFLNSINKYGCGLFIAIGYIVLDLAICICFILSVILYATDASECSTSPFFGMSIFNLATTAHTLILYYHYINFPKQTIMSIVTYF